MSSQKSTSSSPLPPLSIILPPSPPLSPKRRSSTPRRLSPIEHILHSLRRFRCAKLPHSDDSKSFALQPEEFAALQRRIEADLTLKKLFDAKVRWDYDEKGEYTLRMPSLVHEIFTARVCDAIAGAISSLSLRLGGSAGKALRDVRKGGSPTLTLSGPAPPSSSSQDSQEEEVLVETHRSPDGTFFHAGEDGWPGVVLEVSFSQIGRKLDRIAESYIVDSFGGIRCVVGLELPYIRDMKVRSCVSGIDKSARVSVWRAKVEKGQDGAETLSCARDVERVCFVDKLGVTQEGELEVRLGDFLPRDVLDTLDAGVRDEKIVVPFSDLAIFLSEAKRAQEFVKESKQANKPAMKRKKRRRTPEEEMDDEREGKLQRVEDAEAKREQRDDRAWRGSRAESGTRQPERRSQRLSLRGNAAEGAKAEPS